MLSLLIPYKLLNKKNSIKKIKYIDATHIITTPNPTVYIKSYNSHLFYIAVVMTLQVDLPANVNAVQAIMEIEMNPKNNPITKPTLVPIGINHI